MNVVRLYRRCLSGYIHFYHLLLAFVSKYPDLQKSIDARLVSTSAGAAAPNPIMCTLSYSL